MRFGTIETSNMATSMIPITPGRKKTMNGSSTPSSGKKSRVSPSGHTYTVGSRVEAKDFSGQWLVIFCSSH